MRNRLMLALVSGAVLSFGVSSITWAADENFCRDYAHAAVREVQKGLEHDRCRDHMQGTRWSTDWHAHFDWCRHVSRDQADSENDARRDTLEHCLHHDWDH